MSKMCVKNFKFKCSTVVTNVLTKTVPYVVIFMGHRISIRLRTVYTWNHIL